MSAVGGTALAVGLAGCAGDEDGSEPTDDTGEEPEEEEAESEADTDFTGQETVEVDVGAGERGLQFAPAEIEIDPGTTVEWVWTGDGGEHNVVHDVEEPEFESELVDEEGHRFEHTFEEAGTYDYVCTPHEAQDKVGTVEVVD